jgi:chromosome segregation ATPase
MATIEERLGTLDMRVDNLETWAGPGQAEALAEGQRELRADLAKVRQTQDRHTRMLADLISDVSGLKTSVSVLEADNASLKTSFATLQADVVGLKADVATLQADVTGLKADVTTLKTDVAGLKADMAEVKGTLAEILRRLPVPPPGA